MLSISTELLQRIANYLGTRPFNEVAILISDLQKEVNKKAEEKTDGGASLDPIQ